MNSKWMALAILLFAGNLWAYTNCSDASGMNRYADINYRGGPMPRPTTVVDDIKIYLNNNLSSENIKQYDGTVVKAATLVADFNQNSIQVLRTFSDFSKVYAVEVTFRDPSSTFPGGGPPPQIFNMICAENNAPVP